MANYTVFGTNFRDDMKLIDCNKPSKAIEAWIKLQKKYPLNVSITAKTEAEAKKLYKHLNDNIMEVAFECNTETPYTMDYIIEGNHKAPTREYNPEEIEDEMINLSPFCMG